MAQPCHFWQKAHTLYRVARDYQLTHKPINDNHLTATPHHTISDSYLRLLLLSCSHTNQLQAVEIYYLYRALESWCRLVQLRPSDNSDNSVYWIDLSTDLGPIYKQRLLRQDLSQQHLSDIQHSDLLAMDMTKLVYHINAHGHKTCDLHSDDANLPKALKASLISHLLSCWQETKQRKEIRQETCTRVDICIGLGQAHEQLTGGIPFNQFLEHRPQTQALSHHDGHPITLMATDISPKGYCLKWDREQTMPSALKAGELVIIRQPAEQQWEVGTIRWVQRLNSECYIGIERSGQYASPYAIKTTLANGEDTPFFKAMILSKPDNTDNEQLHKLAAEPSQLSHDVQLVAPSMPFAVNQKVSLNHYGSCLQIQLTQLLSGSGSISQYQYRPLT